MNWSKVKHFTEKENWGSPSLMDYDLIYGLDALREYVGLPVIIHCGYATKGHSKKSWHYTGHAVDCHIENMSILDQYLAAERFGFGGIGVYPYWVKPGLHLDTRHLAPYEKGARWVGVMKDRKQIYLALDEGTIVTHLIPD